MTTNHVPYGRAHITVPLLLVTGMAIGGPELDFEIGGLDKKVVRHTLDQKPYIPGSTLKGKLRGLAERMVISSQVEHDQHQSFSAIYASFYEKGPSGQHAHGDNEEEAKECPICRLFGTSGTKTSSPSHLLVYDASLTTESESDLNAMESVLNYTEWKSENTINRKTGVANPRQMERVPKDAVFEVQLVYRMGEEISLEFMEQDLKLLAEAMRFLEWDGIGGSVSRGYGRVKFKRDQLKVEVHLTKVHQGLEDKWKDMITRWLTFESVPLNAQIGGP